MSYGANIYYPCINDERSQKFALEAINKVESSFKKIIKKAYDIPQTLDNKIADKLLGKYSFTEKIKFSQAKIIAR